MNLCTSKCQSKIKSLTLELALLGKFIDTLFLVNKLSNTLMK